MNGKEKLDTALAHKAGPVPFDLGATAVTGIHCSVVEKLRHYYGLEQHPVAIADPYQMLGVIDDDLKAAMGIDTDCITSDSTIFGFKPGSEKEWRTPWGQTVLVSDEFKTSLSAEGDTLIYACGDTDYPPCARMPASGYFFDSIIRGHTYDEDNPHVEDNLEEFTLISQATQEFMQKQLAPLVNSGRGLVAQVGGCAIGDIALVPGPMLKDPKGLRDITEWYMATVADPGYLHQIFEKQTEIALQNLKTTYELLGDAVSVVFICGTDFGTQKAPFCSNETFRSLYQPYYRKMNDWIHQNTMWKSFKHSCGSIRPLLGDIIESGFDIINPVQWSAKNMDAKTLKRDFGHDITFWGGGINTQKTLPYGTPDEVRQEALGCLEIFARDGGYVFNTVHNIQAKTPVENVVALAEALLSFNQR
ncbi:MAG: methyltransferase [Clostridia bacterium]|nr:methyltransferase [Clostridia bacterium]